MEISSTFSLKPIGYMKTVFHFKNGTPRQSSLCQAAKGILTIDKSVFSNPDHSLDGLQEFSHAWVIFMFHKNNNPYSKAKVKPPRLNGRRVGVFSTRSPYRPNSIGLSLVKIDLVQGPTIHLSGIDILDGTPVLDIKPYIPEYDMPLIANDVKKSKALSSESDDPQNMEALPNDLTDVKVPEVHPLEAVSSKVVNHQNHESSTAKPTPQTSNRPPEIDFPPTNSNEKESFLHSKTKNGISSEQSEAYSRHSDHSVAEGFYSLSAALEQAGAMMSSSVTQTFSNGDNIPSKTGDSPSNVFGSITSHYISEINEPSASETSSDQLVEDLVGTVLARAASEVLSSCEDSQLMDQQDGAACVNPKARIDNNTQLNMSHRHNTSSLLQNVPHKGSELSKPKIEENKSTVTAPWLSNPPVQKLKVTFTPDALEHLQRFSKVAAEERFRLQMLSGPEEAKTAIKNILHEEPRSIYRRKRCRDSLYFFALDVLHVTCWFDDNTAQVVRVKPVHDVPHLKEKIERFMLS